MEAEAAVAAAAENEEEMYWLVVRWAARPSKGLRWFGSREGYGDRCFFRTARAFLFEIKVYHFEGSIFSV